MPEDTPLPPSTLTEQRERLISALTAHFASDRIDTDEFEARVDLAYQARTLEELEAVRADLPALQGGALTEAPVRSVASSSEVRDRQMVVAILGGTERKGAWTPASRISVLAMMGGVELDFREARFGPGVTEVTIVAIMGGVNVVVPPGLRVESEGFGLLGGFEGLDQRGASDEPDPPILRLRGVAIMGGVEISERRPGESVKDRRRRLRAERRARGRLEAGE